jgi:hypothetical protein
MLLYIGIGSILLIIVILSIYFATTNSETTTPPPTTRPPTTFTPTTYPPTTMYSYSPPSQGLVAWYNAGSFDNNVLYDLSGNENHTTDITGQLLLSDNLLTGTVDTKITFPDNVLPPNYTFIHVAKYNGPTKGRIFSSKVGNNLSGFWKGNSGVSHFDSWRTSVSSVSPSSNGLLVSVDTNKFYRANGVDRTIDNKSKNGNQFTINNGKYPEYSDFAIGEIIVYDRELSMEEILEIENYLIEKFNIIY